MRTNRITKLMISLSLLIILGTSIASAQQVSTATISERVGFWSDMEGGTSLGSGDDPWGRIIMEFPFQYDGLNVSNVYAYGNGFLSFNIFRQPFSANVPDLGQYPYIVSWYSADLFTTGDLKFKFEGTAPFRTLTIQHTGVRTFLDFSGATFDVQIKLFETSNNIEIMYGTNTGLGGLGIDGWLSFTGSGGINEYINIQPNQPQFPSNIFRSGSNPNTNKFLTSDVRGLMPRGKAYLYLPNPTLAQVYPGNTTVLAKGNVYSGNNRPYVRINRAASQNPVSVSYKISGPLPTSNPEYQTIYTAVDANDIDANELINLNPQPVGDNIFFRMPHAKDIAGRLSDGALDLLTNEDDIPGGEYLVEAVLRTPATGYTQTVTTRFNIAFENDIAIVEKVLPVNKGITTYPLESATGIPVEVLVRNLGSRPITSFTVKGTVRFGGQTSQLADFEWNNESNPLEFGETERIVFANYIPTQVGDHRINFSVELNDAASDDLPANNVLPRLGDPDLEFTVAYEIEGEVTSLVSPSGDSYVGSPINPGVLFTNNGIAEITESNAVLVILDPSGTEVYRDTLLIDQIPSANGLVNTQTFFFKTFFPEEIGVYTANVELDLFGDENPANNERSFTFIVSGPLSGNYTINQAQATSGTNFSSIEDAVNALYTRGVAGDVEFRLFEDVYEVGNPDATDRPALDITGRIIGSENSTIKFVPMPDISTSRAVKINLNSGSGIGVMFGTNAFPTSARAAVYRVSDRNKRDYASGIANISFDGGESKAFHFTLNADTDFRSVFYLSEGSQGVSIMNSYIDDANPNYRCTLPLSVYNANVNRYQYDQNVNSNGTLSAGIYSRNIPPIDRIADGNVLDLDTLINGNNKFIGNDINGFGFGIVSIGIGSLRNPANPAQATRFYNTNNEFSNNRIYNIGKAGIFLGYEENALVKNNRIYNVNSSCDGMAAGILAGGMAREFRFGYNNINVLYDGNEISNVTGSSEVAGIKIVQTRNDVLLSDNFFRFPNVDESSKLWNNIIWGVQAGNANTNVFGIQIMTARNTPNDNWNDGNNPPQFNNYFSKNDWIVNNTIVFLDDNFDNAGTYAPISLYQVQGTQHWNNAIAVLDDDFANGDKQAMILYYGAAPSTGTLTSDRNAYYNPSENLPLVRFVETNAASTIIELGNRNEFFTPRQWLAWGKTDMNSITGDFVSDHEFIGAFPQSLRIKTNPLPSFSILNNRGQNLPALFRNDIDGNLRGEAEERYDIGAVEFDGITSNRDMEVVAITAPLTYKSTAPDQFSDVEYFMTQSPVTLSARVRNNSNMNASGVAVTMKVYREQPNGNYVEEATFTQNVINLFPYESRNIQFTNIENLFVPLTYADFRTGDVQPYSIPAEYQSMEANITPKYRFVLELPNDEINSNNKMEVDTRFYIMKSNVKLLLSSDRIYDIDQDSHIQDIATRLNLDSLVEGFNRLGWIIRLGIENQITDIDIFDRKVWEPRSVNYNMYRTLFWVDGHRIKLDENGNEIANNITRYEKDHITSFLNSGNITQKHNLFFASEEAADVLRTEDPDFLNNVLRVSWKSPGNPLNVDGNYAGKTIRGVDIARDEIFTVEETGFPGDEYPRAALFSVFDGPSTTGRISVAFRYNSHYLDQPQFNQYTAEANRIMGVATSSLGFNLVTLGLDWRHFGDIERTLRALLDYAQKNEGNVIPVELLDFTPLAIGERVNVTWSTGSEDNSSHFVVERALGNELNHDAFQAVGQLDAAGRSPDKLEYGPIVDRNVSFGNTYAYRLKMVDITGEFEYSEIKAVTLTGENGIAFSEAKPNPASDITEITYTLADATNAKAELIDMSGRVVADLSNQLASGNNTLNIELNNLSSGSYTLVITTAGETVTRMISVVR